MPNIIGKVLLTILIVLIALFVYKTIKSPNTASSTISVITTATQSSTVVDEKEKIELIIKEYLMHHPEIIIQAVQQSQERNVQLMETKINKYIKKNKSKIENLLTSPILGNIKSSVTIAFFYDYNCSYCKQASLYISQLIKANSNVKVLLKQLPILGDSSNYAARIALAVYKIVPHKFVLIHDSLMQMEHITKESVEKLLLLNGLNVEIIEKEIAGKEIKQIINENMQLAQNLEIHGAPVYIINGQLIVGLIDLVRLQEIIGMIRNGRSNS